MTVADQHAGKRSSADRAEPQPSSHPFDLDTAVKRVAENIYTATLTDRWSTVRGPSGGYTLATSLRALAAEMPFPDPIATAAFFHAGASPGPVEVHTEIVRRGGTLATGEARLIQGDREILRILASFADLEQATGPSLELGTPPSLLGAAANVNLDPGGAFPGSTLTDRFDYRVSQLHGWRSGRPSGDPTLEFAIDFAQPRPIDPLALSLIVDVCPRAVYELGEYMPLTLQLTTHIRATPTEGSLLGRVKTRHLQDGYHEEDLDLWDSRANSSHSRGSSRYCPTRRPESPRIQGLMELSTRGDVARSMQV